MRKQELKKAGVIDFFTESFVLGVLQYYLMETVSCPVLHPTSPSLRCPGSTSLATNLVIRLSDLQHDTEQASQRESLYTNSND